MINTKWCVITGAPSSGKTTVLQILGTLGYRWMPEMGRIYIENKLAQGFSIESILQNEEVLHKDIEAAVIKTESELPPNEVIFLDRAVPDTISYARLRGIDPGKSLEASHRYRYSLVFIFDPLKLHQDGVRFEDETKVKYLDKQFELDYRALGYDVVRVPVMSVQQRVNLILTKLKNSFVQR